MQSTVPRKAPCVHRKEKVNVAMDSIGLVEALNPAAVDVRVARSNAAPMAAMTDTAIA